MAKTKPKDGETKRKSKRQPKGRISFTAVLLFLMVVIGFGSGLVAYRFGQQALQGVNTVPAGVKIPKPSPSPTEKPKKNSEIFLDEKEAIASVKQQVQEEFARTTRGLAIDPLAIYTASNSPSKRLAQNTQPTLKNAKNRLEINRSKDKNSSSLTATVTEANDQPQALTDLPLQGLGISPTEMQRINQELGQIPRGEILEKQQAAPVSAQNLAPTNQTPQSSGTVVDTSRDHPQGQQSNQI